MITISIVEDDTLIRNGLRLLIDGEEGFSCLGDYATGEDALVGIPRDAPDVVLMDIHLPGISGIECVAELRRAKPDLLVMMLTMYEDDENILAALRAGASGYLVKKTPPADLLRAVTDLHAGGSPMSGQIARRVVAAFQNAGPATPELAVLTRREYEVLEYLARGYRYQEIADLLFISVDTVRTHIRHIYEKLQVRSRNEAVMKLVGR